MNDQDWISATEIASYGYCPEAWRLGHGLKLESANAAELKQGIARHDHWDQVEQRSSRLLHLALWLLALAVLAWIATSVMGGR